MPVGVLVIVPPPVPAFVIVRSNVSGSMVKVAVTDCAAVSEMVQTPVPVQAPLQPVKEEPATGAAVRVTLVPWV